MIEILSVYTQLVLPSFRTHRGEGVSETHSRRLVWMGEVSCASSLKHCMAGTGAQGSPLPCGGGARCGQVDSR